MADVRLRLRPERRVLRQQERLGAFAHSMEPGERPVEGVNYSAGNATGLVARAEILNMDGSRKWAKSVPLDASEDSVQSPIHLEYPSGLTAVDRKSTRLHSSHLVIS